METRPGFFPWASIIGRGGISGCSSARYACSTTQLHIFVATGGLRWLRFATDTGYCFTIDVPNAALPLRVLGMIWGTEMTTAWMRTHSALSVDLICDAQQQSARLQWMRNPRWHYVRWFASTI